jgi:hypothetical protein
MDASEIAFGWKRAFGDFLPIGYVCREHLRDRWVRVHSLPDSKRYPESEAEYLELLRRHNEVATAVLGDGADCVLFMVVFGRPPEVLDPVFGPIMTESGLIQVNELTARADPDPESPLARVGAIPVQWRSAQFDPALRAVAEDRGRVLFANLSSGTAYAPYDGGRTYSSPLARRCHGPRQCGRSGCHQSHPVCSWLTCRCSRRATWTHPGPRTTS